jgi:hypothetical protein
MGRSIIDLDWISALAERILYHGSVAAWLTDHNSSLNGAEPLTKILLEGHHAPHSLGCSARH